MNRGIAKTCFLHFACILGSFVASVQIYTGMVSAISHFKITFLYRGASPSRGVMHGPWNGNMQYVYCIDVISWARCMTGSDERLDHRPNCVVLIQLKAVNYNCCRMEWLSQAMYKALLIGASLSEPHTSELALQFFLYVCMYVCMVRTSYRMYSEDLF